MRLFKRGNIWWVDFRVGNRRIRKSLKTTNRKTAEVIAQKLYDDALKKQAGILPPIRLSEMIRLFLAWARINKRSWRHDEIRLEKILKILGDLELHEIKPLHVEHLKAVLKREGKKPATINRYLAVLKTLFNKAEEWERFDGKNPVRKVRFFKESNQKHTYTMEELEKLLKAAKELSENAPTKNQFYFYYVLLLAAFTGMRLSEILNLHWSDFKYNYVIVRQSKSGKHRIVPVPTFVAEEIENLPREDERIFALNAKRDLPSAIKTAWKKVRKIAGVEGRFHDLRHTFATLLLHNGVDIITVKEILGHSSVKVTQVYSHTDLIRMKEAVERLSKGTKLAQRHGIFQALPEGEGEKG